MYDMRLDAQGNLLPGKTWDDSPGLPPAEAEMVLSMLDVPITIDRCFVEICSDLAAAAMLTELSTVESETGRQQVWLQIAPDEFSRRLALTEPQQRAARRLLRSKGLIAHRRRKALGTDSSTDEFRILWPAVVALLQRKAQERTAHIVWPPVRRDRPDQPHQPRRSEEVES